MMNRLKYILLFVACSSVIPVVSQDYDHVDATILLYPERFNAAEELSSLITRDFATDDEKVRAMYSWIIQNVAYEPDEYEKFNYNFKNYKERNEKEEKTREKTIKRTLQKGIAVCEGYAMLLEKLCELQGIKNYLVRGDTKTHFNDIGRPFSKNHMWNVIILNGQPHLFDATWGAGKFNGNFVKDPSYFYFKTPPEAFFKSHYPDMIEDAFVAKNITRQEFSERPIIINRAMMFAHLETPKEGILYAENYFGDIPFRIKDSAPKEVTFTFGKEVKPVKDMNINNGILSFNVPLELGVTSLLIYFDGEPALAYKIK